MDNQKIMRFLFILVPVLVVLSIWWNVFAPFLSIAHGMRNEIAAS